MPACRANRSASSLRASIMAAASGLPGAAFMTCCSIPIGTSAISFLYGAGADSLSRLVSPLIPARPSSAQSTGLHLPHTMRWGSEWPLGQRQKAGAFACMALVIRCGSGSRSARCTCFGGMVRSSDRSG